MIAKFGQGCCNAKKILEDLEMCSCEGPCKVLGSVYSLSWEESQLLLSARFGCWQADDRLK